MSKLDDSFDIDPMRYAMEGFHLDRSMLNLFQVKHCAKCVFAEIDKSKGTIECHHPDLESDPYRPPIGFFPPDTLFVCTYMEEKKDEEPILKG